MSKSVEGASLHSLSVGFTFLIKIWIDRNLLCVCSNSLSLSLSLISGCVFVSQHGVLQLIDSCTHLFFFSKPAR